jgi:hypothetical protein
MRDPLSVGLGLADQQLQACLHNGGLRDECLNEHPLATSTRLARSSRNGGSTRTSTRRTRLNGLTPSESTTKKRRRGSRRTSIQKEFAHCANDQDERHSGNQQLPVHHCNSLSNHRNETVQRQTPKLKRSDDLEVQTGIGPTDGRGWANRVFRSEGPNLTSSSTIISL